MEDLTAPLARIVINMNNHSKKYNDILEEIIKRDCYPKEILQMTNAVSSSLKTSHVIINLLINSINKKSQDDFMKFLAPKAADRFNNLKAFLMYNSISMIATYVFVLENCFKAILEDKKIEVPGNLEQIINEISKVSEINDNYNIILHILRRMRNSLHGNLTYGKGRSIIYVDDGYIFNCKKGIPAFPTSDYSSKIILQTSMVLKKIIENLYPNKS